MSEKLKDLFTALTFLFGVMLGVAFMLFTVHYMVIAVKRLMGL